LLVWQRPTQFSTRPAALPSDTGAAWPKRPPDQAFLDAVGPITDRVIVGSLVNLAVIHRRAEQRFASRQPRRLPIPTSDQAARMFGSKKATADHAPRMLAAAGNNFRRLRIEDK
jgi:hypothetical protein